MKANLEQSRPDVSNLASMVKIPPAAGKAKLVCLASKVGGGVGEAVAVVDCVVWVWWYVVVVLVVVLGVAVQVVLVGRVWLGGEAGIRRRWLVHRQPRAWIFTWNQGKQVQKGTGTPHHITCFNNS